MSAIGDTSAAALVGRFLSTDAGERAHSLTRLLRDAIADHTTTQTLVITDGNGDAVGLIARRAEATTMEVSLLRVAGPLATTISRHLVHLQRLAAVEDGLPLVRVSDPYISSALVSALIAEGFTQLADGWFTAPFALQTDIHEFASRLQARGMPLGLVPGHVIRELEAGKIHASVAGELERQHSPLKLLGAAITTYLVPIKHEWARQLFDVGLSEETLFPRHEILGISREHVYYSGSARTLRLPARIVWYVSGREKWGARRVRAVSRLEEAVVGRPRTLYRRYQHLGVWRREQVEASASRGRALALRFADTELLKRPVTLAELRTIADESRHTLVLRSISELPEHMFAQIYKVGNDVGADKSSTLPLAEAAVRRAPAER